MARFTAANARENAAKAHASRQQRLARGKLAGESSPQPPQAGPDEAAASYLSRRLFRVRAQLDLVDKAFETEASKATPDGQRLNWLAQAQERLSEQERILAGRPLPGSRRPKDNGSQIPVPGAWIIHDEPEPAVQSPAPSEADACPTQPAARMVEDEPVPQVAKDGSVDSLLVEAPTPTPTDTPTPPTRRIVVTTATAAMMPSVPTVSPNLKPPGGAYGSPPSMPVVPLPG